jgi:predicted permease
MRTVGKVFLAIVLAIVGFAGASFVGGFIVGAFGSVLHWSTETVDLFLSIFPKAIFLGVLVCLYVWEKRKKTRRAPHDAAGRNR